MSTKQSGTTPSKAETKADQTTAIVKDILEEETSAREAKTHRLRVARLEREAAERAATAANPPEKGKKRASKSAKRKA